MTKDILENDPYKKAGVDIEAGDLLVKKIKKIVKRTHINGVLGGIGGFAGMFELSKSYKNPVLVACTDGVGTKVNLAAQNNNLNIIGQDLVAMCVNDMITCGASPLFFLDYYGTSKLKIDEAAIIIESISNACIESNCALLGGETAEMPNHYKGRNFDLAGFSVGCVDKDKIITTVEDNLGIPNTFVWSPDNKNFYFTDTLDGNIMKYDYDVETGNLSNKNFFAKFDRGFPDGSTIDTDGCLWNCRWGGSCVVRYTPSGEVDQVIELPVENITNCVFGGKDLKTLFITSAKNPGKNQHELDGSLFSINLNNTFFKIK